MWKCKKCGEKVEETFDSCWKCSTPRDDSQSEASTSPGISDEKKPKWRLVYKYFRGTWETWDNLFAEAALFATEVGPERVVGISHSADDSDGVVTVWYWTDKEEDEPSKE
jgi:hypothetical protein